MRGRRAMPGFKAGKDKAPRFAPRDPDDDTPQREKVHKVMGEFKRGSLKSSSGQKVSKRAQAVAIALNEAGLSKKKRRKKK